jgi:hypothetical protein
MTKIKETQSKAGDEAKNMMKIMSDHDKKLDHSSCIDSQLFNFKNKQYVQGICRSYYGPVQASECSQKKEFCEKCCSHQIGLKYSNLLFECKKKCTNLVEGLNDEINMKNLKN